VWQRNVTSVITGSIEGRSLPTLIHALATASILVRLESYLSAWETNVGSINTFPLPLAGEGGVRVVGG